MPGPSTQEPSRRPRISHEFVEEHRRRRYVDVTAELLHEFGRKGPSVTNIVRLAGTARNSFYDLFDSGEHCIGYGIDLAVRELFATLAAQDGEREWATEVEEAITGFFGAVAADPMLAELFLIHAAASRLDHGREAARRGAEAFAVLFGRGHQEAEERGLRPPPVVAGEYFSRTVVSLAARRVRGPGVAALVQEARPTAALVVSCYLGPAAAEGLLGGRTELAGS